MDIWRNGIQQDVNYLKSSHSKLKEDVADLKVNDKIQDQEINSLKVTLGEIKEDTQWIRRKITGALITAIISAVITGIVAIGISQIYG